MRIRKPNIMSRDLQVIVNHENSAWLGCGFSVCKLLILGFLFFSVRL